MPNVIDANGIQIQTLDEILDEILNGTEDYPGMYQIYGADINVLPNSPDGQFIHIFAQAKLDMLEMIQQIFTSFDPDQAVGVQLDERCALNGVVRNPGTYTVTNVLVTVTQAVTIPGLDTAPDAPFTVSDASGNQYQLIAANAFGGAGSTALAFQASTLGEITPALNTITNIVTLILGVASVNNPGAATTIGTDEESDFSLRIRRARSVALPSKGFYQGLIAALTVTAGVTSINLLENVTDVVDADGIPGHSIWAIVAGGTDADVANAIYVKRNAGCGMKGAVVVNVTQVDATVFPIKFDRPQAEDLWIKFDIAAVTGSVDPDYIRTQLLAQLSYDIGQDAVISDIIARVMTLAPNASVDAAGVSPDNVTYTALLAPTGVDYQFGTSSPHIIINGAPGP